MPAEALTKIELKSQLRTPLINVDVGPQGPPGAVGSTGADGIVQSLRAGPNILIDSTNPASPLITALPTASFGGDMKYSDIVLGQETGYRLMDGNPLLLADAGNLPEILNIYQFTNAPFPQSRKFDRVLTNGTIAVGVNFAGRIYSSTDGLNWTSRHTLIAFSDAIYHAGLSLFIVLTYDGNVAVSTDGITWADHLVSNNGGANAVFSLAQTAAAVCFGEWDGDGAHKTTFWTSTNGTTSWTHRTPSISNGEVHVTASSTTFVAFQQQAVDTKVWSSSDNGATWTLHTITSSSTSIDFVTCANDLFVAGSFINGGTLVTAPANGLTWTERSTGPAAGAGGNVIKMVYAFGSYFLLISNSPLELWASADGLTWANNTGNLPEALDDITFKGSTMIAVTYPNMRFYATPDGTVWTEKFTTAVMVTGNKLMRADPMLDGFAIYDTSDTSNGINYSPEPLVDLGVLMPKGPGDDVTHFYLRAVNL